MSNRKTYEVISTRKLDMKMLMTDDSERENAAGRVCDFSGSDFRTRDMGWEDMTSDQAIAMRDNLGRAFPGDVIHANEVDDA